MGDRETDCIPKPTAAAAEETDDLGGGLPPRPYPQPEDIGEVLRHLDDACPVITSDPLEAQEISARYIIGDELGSGAIGQVIEAYDVHLGRSVAIKILHGGPGVSRDRLARFIAEAQITAQLEHPAIVPVHEIGRMPGGMPYFSMKRIRGESLEDVINHLRVGDEDYRQHLEGKTAARLFFRICQGIAYAHAKGVVHRDLKPANILIGQYGAVQIMDWGLARILGEGASAAPEPVQTVRGAPDLGTLDGEIAGTPAYMSPEQARAETSRIGPPSDVYSLGLIFAELLSLVRVFRNPASEATLREVREAGPIEAGELNPNIRIPADLAAAIRKCTEPDPARRYRDAGELAEDIRSFLEDRTLSSGPDTGHRVVVKWSRRHPRSAGILLGVLGILALEAIGLLLGSFA